MIVLSTRDMSSAIIIKAQENGVRKRRIESHGANPKCAHIYTELDEMFKL